MIDILREARAALLNPNLTESERAVSVRRIEACIDMLMIQKHGTPPAPPPAHGDGSGGTEGGGEGVPGGPVRG